MGLLDKIKQAFSNTVSSVTSLSESEFDKVLAQTHAEQKRLGGYFWGMKLNSINEYANNVVNWDDKKKIDFIIYCIVEIAKFYREIKSYSSSDENWQKIAVAEAYLAQLFKTKLTINEDDLKRLIEAFLQNKKWDWAALNRWPVLAMINQLSRQYKNGVPEGMLEPLTDIKNVFEKITDHYLQKEKLKIIEKINALLFTSIAQPEEIKPTLFLGEDRFAMYANNVINNLPLNEREIWYQLIARAIKASGAKPSAKYLNETKVLFKQLGVDKFKSIVNDWFAFVIGLKEITTVHNSSGYSYSTSVFLNGVSVDAIKGFVWMCAHFHDSNTLNNLAKLAERCYKKMPGVGPVAAAIGNACLFALFTSKGLDGIGHLSRLKLRVKQASAQQTIERYIEQAADDKGVTIHEIEDMAVDGLGLIAGKRIFEFENYTCELHVTGIGKSELSWIKADGTPQKSVPVSLKDQQSTRIKKIKEVQKQVDVATSAQRDRIDRMLRSSRKMSMDYFNEYYLNHGLISFIAKKIIWNITISGNTVSVIKKDDEWVDSTGTVVLPEVGALISLWHPATASVQEVKQWRNYLISNQIQQPLKQGFREVYLLTEAELNTRVYSNRMAAHVLKQHQFNMLAKTRGWKYALMGAFDNGINNGSAQLQLPEYGLKAEFWINEVAADDAFNETGIWNYVATDQIRFTRIADGEVVNLIDVPALPFTEVLRDVDLFVGVASIGNDPNWQDSGGVVALNTYWRAYSFGDLSELAKNRKEILEGLLPRLKINKVAAIKDKFLVVEGKLRTYKIHIGSTNILMEPNDQYLCIVPDRTKTNVSDNLFIPFEGDAGLSVILSKALMLADDDKITDKTITSQIKTR
ncbi:DUF4132 domain-containing protein [Mucilaginibacter auburnensis]|uniref:Uncharacterized protein DUF4132 n=1 Tax=Mucilaginibacter auburnensis TaxID=1457233 RepID=A0A2H9VNY5_9SPHI|nr:DUF4132 domain-containing protein [Mucilaginibacter auburnensis]PJJ80036.1 uncharacterized protein DUF4132 [Mucilaginibacter auburnensis]